MVSRHSTYYSECKISVALKLEGGLLRQSSKKIITDSFLALKKMSNINNDDDDDNDNDDRNSGWPHTINSSNNAAAIGLPYIIVCCCSLRCPGRESKSSCWGDGDNYSTGKHTVMTMANNCFSLVASSRAKLWQQERRSVLHLVQPMQSILTMLEKGCPSTTMEIDRYWGGQCCQCPPCWRIPIRQRTLFFHGGTMSTRWSGRRRGCVTDARCLRTSWLDHCCCPPCLQLRRPPTRLMVKVDSQQSTVNQRGVCVASLLMRRSVYLQWT